MNTKKVVMMLAMIVVLGLFLTITVDEAFAQDVKNVAADKNIAQKKGVAAALTTSKPAEEVDGATGLQMAIGVGSLFVMFGVLKYT